MTLIFLSKAWRQETPSKHIRFRCLWLVWYLTLVEGDASIIILVLNSERRMLLAVLGGRQRVYLSPHRERAKIFTQTHSCPSQTPLHIFPGHLPFTEREI
jgi:hypothetical protein